MDASLRGILDPVVTIAVSRGEAGEISIQVSDTGPGVIDEKAIFRRGFTTKQGHGSETDATAHHGVGLALVGQSVRRLGGDIRVDSDAGATFTVRIPR